MDEKDWDKKDLDIEKPLHYYGDIVRKLFLAGAVLMLLTLPFFNDLIAAPVAISILAVIVLGLIAGFVNPRELWVSILNTGIAAGAIFIFEYHAVDTYPIKSARYQILFWVDQVLALLFLIALYYSVKTLRGMSQNR